MLGVSSGFFFLAIKFGTETVWLCRFYSGPALSRKRSSILVNLLVFLVDSSVLVLSGLRSLFLSGLACLATNSFSGRPLLAYWGAGPPGVIGGAMLHGAPNVFRGFILAFSFVVLVVCGRVLLYKFARPNTFH